MLHAGQYGVGAGLRSRVLPDERGRHQTALLIVDPGQRLFQFCDQRLDALNGHFVRYLTCDCLVSLDPLFEALGLGRRTDARGSPGSAPGRCSAKSSSLGLRAQVGVGSSLCEYFDVELARRNVVSITLNRKRTALAVAVERGKGRRGSSSRNSSCSQTIAGRSPCVPVSQAYVNSG